MAFGTAPVVDLTSTPFSTGLGDGSGFSSWGDYSTPLNETLPGGTRGGTSSMFNLFNQPQRIDDILSSGIGSGSLEYRHNPDSGTAPAERLQTFQHLRLDGDTQPVDSGSSGNGIMSPRSSAAGLWDRGGASSSGWDSLSAGGASQTLGIPVGGQLQDLISPPAVSTFALIASGDVEGLGARLEAMGPQAVSETDASGSTPLHAAVRVRELRVEDDGGGPRPLRGVLGGRGGGPVFYYRVELRCTKAQAVTPTVTLLPFSPSFANPCADA